jgi:hypothetical protein
MPTTVRLSVRSKELGRYQYPDPVRFEHGNMTDLAQSRILLLVHGFANPEETAVESYDKFAAGLTAVKESFPGDWGAVCEFHWPGDDNRGSLRSKATYPLRIDAARSSAGRLYDFLHGEDALKPDKSLYIAAHSLGCRLTLEFLREIVIRGTYGGPVVREVVLMAAAVPIDTCLPRSGWFLPGETRHEHVLFSGRDMVLHYVFGIGQRIPGEHGHAVGREGRPEKRWWTRTSTGLGHGEYWGKYAVAKRVSAIIGIGPVELPEHYPPQVEFDIAEPPRFRRMVGRVVSWRE